jgi:hypothetical protein
VYNLFGLEGREKNEKIALILNNESPLKAL